MPHSAVAINYSINEDKQIIFTQKKQLARKARTYYV